MSSLESKCNLQRTRLGLLENAFTFFQGKDPAEITKCQIQTRLEVLESNWTKFDEENDQLCEGKLDKIKDLPYFTENQYCKGQEAYIIGKSAMLDLLSTITSSQQSNNELLNSSVNSNFRQQPILPKITLPQFAGDYQNWKPFCDLFTSLIIDNPDLSDVAKMHYLKNSLTKDAAQLVSNFQISGENFVVAWEKLKSRFENKRVLINKHLDDIFKLKPVIKKTSKNVSNLMSTVSESLGSLKALGSPTDQWDHIIVYVIVNRLDPETHEAWEVHQGASTEPPKLEELQNFIEGRCRALESIEMREFTRSSTVTASTKPQGNFTQRPKVHVSSVDSSKPKITCILCKENHYLSNCNAFSKKSDVQRKEYIISQKLCFNCLGHHYLKDCHSQKTCLKCKKRHHTLIHDAVNPSTNVSNQDKPTSQSNSSNIQEANHHMPSKEATVPASSNHTLPNIVPSRPAVLLATAQVKLLGPNGNSIVARALIDQGSEISFISEYLVQTLHLKRTSSSISLVGIGGCQSLNTRGMVSITLKSLSKDNSCALSAHILPKLTSDLPSMKPNQTTWPHIKGLKLADPNFMNPSSIDLILGADIYGTIILNDIIKGPPSTPVVQSTIFGWILSGPTGGENVILRSSTNHCMVENKVDELLQKFWVQEEINEKAKESPLSPDDQECEEHFLSTFTRKPSGRYEVRLPLKQSVDNLGKSESSAFKMLQSLQNRLSSDPEYNNLYTSFVHEYEHLNHMVEVTSDKDSTIPIYYLPHHGVLRTTSLTTKLRVVFNASFPTTSGLSLNDILHSGPKLQTNLPDVLTWFRRFKYVFAADIEKMYRQILVHPDDQNLQRILWFENENLRKYKLQTVTYGLSCAPFLALRTLDQLINDDGIKFPLAVETMKRGRYVDDIFGGADTIDDCQNLVKQVDGLTKSGCFPLQKWISTEPSILSHISSTNYQENQSLVITDSCVHRTLGLTWNQLTDEFQFISSIETVENVTKRNVLSKVAQLFDPLGFIAPVIIQAKIFIQQLWLIKLNWDDPLPPHLKKQWQKFEAQLNDLSSIHISRFLGTSRTSHLQLHGFSDASTLAMSAVIYVKVTHENHTRVSFVCAKTKVAPLKKMTVPRLELTAATMLVKLSRYARQILDANTADLWLWTDSSVALTWIINQPSKWKEFVSNRVNFIQQTEPSAHWRFVPGTENPADCATRGISPVILSNHDLWWSGPSWLVNNSDHWPTSSFVPTKEAESEERHRKCHKTIHVSTQQNVAKEEEPDLLNRYSTLNRLLRITAWCLKFKAKSMSSGNAASTPHHLSPSDLNEALLRWISIVQELSFKNELKCLKDHKTVEKSSPLKTLNPFIDKDGLVRVGGRLSRSSFDYDTKHPFILPKDSSLSALIIHDTHLKTQHGNIRETLSTVRQRFWILGGRPVIKRKLLRCVTCARYRAKRAQQLMGQLPPARMTPSRPFLHSNVDYAGPFVIKTWGGRNTKTYKGYIALFICSSTSAIHLELVTDYTSETFLAAYKRFTSRRGICATLTSDCGTTFVGAAAELKTLFSQSSAELNNLRNLLANDGTQWLFNPPGAPHFGGRHEAGVKSVKYHLKRVIGNNLLTYEEFSTILTQTEAILNSRPLCRLTEDPDDLAVLTPAHFLIGEPLTTVPEPNLIEVSTSRLTRWKLTRQMLESFWNIWSKEYLQELQSIYKWRNPSNDIEVGSLVLIIDEQYPPSKWPLARVVQTHPGKDNLIRVVTLKTATSTFKRPVVKLCPLPVEKT